MSARAVQPGHKFVIGTAIRRQGGVWVEATTVWDAVVDRIISSTVFSYITEGVLEWKFGSLTPDETLYTSGGTAIGTAMDSKRLLLALRVPSNLTIADIAGLETRLETIENNISTAIDITPWGQTWIIQPSTEPAKVILNLSMLQSSIIGAQGTITGTLSADRSYTVPDQDGTFALLEREQTFTKRQYITVSTALSTSDPGADTVAIGAGNINLHQGLHTWGGTLVTHDIGPIHPTHDTHTAALIIDPPGGVFPAGGMFIAWNAPSVNPTYPLAFHIGMKDVNTAEFSAEGTGGMEFWTAGGRLMLGTTQLQIVGTVAPTAQATDTVTIGKGRILVKDGIFSNVAFSSSYKNYFSLSTSATTVHIENLSSGDALKVTGPITAQGATFSGNINIHGASYVWPTSNTAGSLINDGAGNLSWTPDGGGTVTTVSVVTANGVSGSVANPTTTPAITITLGAITPSSVAATGTVTGSNLSGTNTGDQTITLTGNVTGSGTGSFAATIANDAVTYAKMQNVSAASRVIGRGSASGSGDPEELSIGAGLAISGTTLQLATGTGGGVTGNGTANFFAKWTGTNTIGDSASIREDSGRITIFDSGTSFLNAYQLQVVRTAAGASRMAIEQHQNSIDGSGIYLTTHTSGGTLMSQVSLSCGGSTDAGQFKLQGVAGAGAEVVWLLASNANGMDSKLNFKTSGSATITAGGNISGANLSGTNTGDQTITLTGNVTGSGTGSFAATIANDAVTYAKMQNVSAASRLIGRGSASGSGDPEEITLDASLTMTGTTLSVSGGAGSAITALTGDVTATGPGSVAATIANDAVTYAKIQNVSAASKLLGRGAASGSGDVQEITLGTGLAMSGTTLNATGGTVSGLTTGRVPFAASSTTLTDSANFTFDAITGLVVGTQTNFLDAAWIKFPAAAVGVFGFISGSTTKWQLWNRDDSAGEFQLIYGVNGLAQQWNADGTVLFNNSANPATPSTAQVTIGNGKVYAYTGFGVGASAGLSVTITTAKLTTLGSNGSMTFTGGILTAQTAAT